MEVKYYNENVTYGLHFFFHHSNINIYASNRIDSGIQNCFYYNFKETIKLTLSVCISADMHAYCKEKASVK